LTVDIALTHATRRPLERWQEPEPMFLASRAAELRQRHSVVLQRNGAEPFPGRRKDRVEHRRGGDADGRLADATPEAAGRHDDRLDLRHLAEAHHVVIIEVRLLDRAAFDSALLIEQSRETVDE